MLKVLPEVEEYWCMLETCGKTGKETKKKQKAVTTTKK